MRQSTSEVIAERILVEAKILLKHTQKDVSEIAYLLRLRKSTHVHSFFEKHANVTSTKFHAV